MMKIDLEGINSLLTKHSTNIYAKYKRLNLRLNPETSLYCFPKRFIGGYFTISFISPVGRWVLLLVL